MGPWYRSRAAQGLWKYCPRGEAGESPALVRNREWCAEETDATEPGYLAADEFPPSRHKDRSSVRLASVGSRAEVRERIAVTAFVGVP